MEHSETVSPAYTDLEKTLIGYWQDALSLEQIGLDDHFFDRGGTSIQAMRVVGRINKDLKVKLAVSTLYQLSTVRQLSKKITTDESDGVAPILLLKEGDGTPLFIFPPWSSYPTIFDEFVAEYKGDSPLYGIIYTEDSDNFPFKSLQEYASYIISQMKTLYPHGPYKLLGYSMGARTILEVAIQLQAMGEKIELLGAISHYPANPDKKLFLNRKMRDEIRIFTKINSRFKVKYLKNRLPHFLKLLFTGKYHVDEITVENTAQKQILAIHNSYQTSAKYQGDLLLIYETSPDGVSTEFRRAQVYRNSIFNSLWKRYITGNVVVKIVECKHIDFFKKPAVNKITEIIELYK